MADSAPAAMNTARAIRSIPLSAPVGVCFTTLVFMSAIPLKSNFLVVAIVEHSNQKGQIWAIVRLLLSLW